MGCHLFNVFRIFVFTACVVVFLSTIARADEDYPQKRQQLIATIQQDVEETSLYLDTRALDTRVMEAMAKVPRHEFVPERLRSRAYENRPLPIGYGQTISQPYIVAVMTDLLKVTPDSKVLEVGTGSGYQAAILAELVDKVFSIEIIKPLSEQAHVRLKQLKYANVQLKYGDGYYGWEEQAPFDAIVVTYDVKYRTPSGLDDARGSTESPVTTVRSGLPW